jgi:hypothetical protein
MLRFQRVTRRKNIAVCSFYVMWLKTTSIPDRGKPIFALQKMPGAKTIYPAILASWLSNETPEIFVSWIRQPGNSVLVELDDGIILGVGWVTDAGEINLNKVPTHRSISIVDDVIVELHTAECEHVAQKWRELAAKVEASGAVVDARRC